MCPILNFIQLDKNDVFASLWTEKSELKYIEKLNPEIPVFGIPGLNALFTRRSRVNYGVF